MDVGTLIGIVVTAGGVVVGADGAVSEQGKMLRNDVVKICQLGPRTVATIQGQYGLSDPSGASAQLYSEFHASCNELRQTNPKGTTSELAVHLITRLHAVLQGYLSRVPPKSFRPPFFPDSHIVYVAVAGVDAGIGRVTVQNIRVNRSPDGRWSAYTREAPKLGLTGCGVTFHGHDRVAWGLLRDDARLPLGLRESAVVKAARALQPAMCRDVSLNDARSLFLIALRSTVDHGERFSIPPSAVGGRATIVTIRSDGYPLRAESVTKY